MIFVMINLEAIFERLRPSIFAEFPLEVVRKKYCVDTQKTEHYFNVAIYSMNRFSNSCLQIIDKMRSKWSNSKFSKHTMFVSFEFQDAKSI